MFKIARVGDMCSHGAQIITGDPTRIINDKKVARVGDMVNCPIHGVNQIIASNAKVVITTEKKTSHVVSLTKCGAQIITGSEDFKIDVQPE